MFQSPRHDIGRCIAMTMLRRARRQHAGSSFYPPHSIPKLSIFARSKTSRQSMFSLPHESSVSRWLGVDFKDYGIFVKFLRIVRIQVVEVLLAVGADGMKKTILNVT